MTEQRLVELLEEARALGFLGPGPVDTHIAHAESFLPHLAATPGIGLDLGSGAGIPGLVLALRRPGWRWVFLDANRRRTSFLDEAVRRLEIAGSVVVVRGRAELLAHDPEHRAKYDVVTSRAFAGPGPTAEVGGAFLRIDGRLLVSEPPGETVRWLEAELEALGLIRGAGGRIQELVRTADLPPHLPRRTAFTRPLF